MEPENPPDPDISAALAAYFGLSAIPCDGADLSRIEKLAAAIDSANYLNTQMAGCARYETDAALLAAAMAARTIRDGLVLEFGVFSGRTINHLAALEPGRVVGFDSFEGLPEDWRADVPKSSFKRAGPPEVKANVELVVGRFEATLPAFVTANPAPVAFLHIDCDLYSSTKTVFRILSERIGPGAAIVFDEYFNYVGWRNHEYKAFAEFIAETGLTYRYFGAVPAHQQVAVIIGPPSKGVRRASDSGWKS
jgi:predicted O-methyltransferase YrrM